MFKKLFGQKKNDKEVKLVAALTGEIIPIERVEDPVFAQKMAGDGLAIVPTQGEVVAPISGKVTHLFDTHHAIGITTKEGLEILIHIGIDTVKLDGKGFNAYVEVGDEVKQGERLITVDLNLLKESGFAISTPIVITNGEVVAEQKVLATGNVIAGEDEILSILLK
ncbi:PTS sugar transporter subunit IIA [Thermoflavimicrobium daqui]|uniref:PTS glucose transporter subunit IIA n=1 Tax=Thermoflavimicrobium daqui TaxID=2137476 RepID=A0A364K4H9_9BACL|nr:PTS glucose transporter subunit IIA [Thermoflavimicrobium daqui]RAL24280.1 PTS glucose transporter subunit IIA [Thermoflavimicrobium daqui]